jgi:multiple sugar transport system ATP-binding protein
VPRVVIERLSKAFVGSNRESILAVEDVNLTIADKELLVIVGPSGCGKTTTLRLIAGLEEPTAGTISIDGKDLARVPPKDRGVAMMFQNPALYPHMTVRENLAFGLKLRHCPKGDLEKRVRATAELLEIADCLDRKPEALSGGQRQRVALGRALVQEPKVLLLDEPLSNLDPQMRLQMRIELRRLHARLSTSMIYVTHDQTEAMTMGDRVAVMDGGRLQQVAAPMELYNQPANMFVAAFLGFPAMNFFEGTIVDRAGTLSFIRRESADSPLTLQISDSMAHGLAGCKGQLVILGIRPEDIVPAISRNGDESGAAVEAIVEMLEPLGWETHVHLTRSSFSFTARTQAGSDLRPNQKLRCGFRMEKAHFFDPATQQRIVAK